MRLIVSLLSVAALVYTFTFAHLLSHLRAGTADSGISFIFCLHCVEDFSPQTSTRSRLMDK